jgi:hypothetical protein
MRVLICLGFLALSGCVHKKSSTCIGHKAAGVEHTISGTVTEVIHKDGIIFIKLQTASQASPTWAAVLSGDPKIGQEVSIFVELVIKKFYSKVLNREFEAITFGRLS